MTRSNEGGDGTMVQFSEYPDPPVMGDEDRLCRVCGADVWGMDPHAPDCPGENMCEWCGEIRWTCSTPGCEAAWTGRPEDGFPHTPALVPTEEEVVSPPVSGYPVDMGWYHDDCGGEAAKALVE